MRYRKLDSNGDYSFGHGAADFWHNVPEAPAQAVRTRLSLWQGEWYLDNREGMPWNTRVLGVRTANTRDAVIRRHVLRTQDVTEILAYSSALVRDTRQFVVNVEIDTTYGRFQIGSVT